MALQPLMRSCHLILCQALLSAYGMVIDKNTWKQQIIKTIEHSGIEIVAIEYASSILFKIIVCNELWKYQDVKGGGGRLLREKPVTDITSVH